MNYKLVKLNSAHYVFTDLRTSLKYDYKL